MTSARPTFALFVLLAACSTSSPDGGGVDAGGQAEGGDVSSPDGHVADSGPADGATANGADAAAAPDAISSDASGSDGGVGPYDHDGTGAFTTFTASLTNGASTFTETLYVPGALGAHPAVSLSPGLQQPAAAYAPFAKRLASWGVIALLRDDPGFGVQTTSVTQDIAYVVATWLPAQAADMASPLYTKVDLTRVGLAGHSRGGQASLIAAENPLKGKVVAWFGLDPVDSTTFSGGTQARTNLGTVGIPTTFLGASVSSSCSPIADNYQVLYAAAPSPSVSLTGIGAGHTQFEDPATCAACGLCTPAGTADGPTVLAYAVRYLTAFFARELQGDSSVGPTFGGAGAPADVAAGRVQLTSK